MTVLFVDDEKQILRGLERMLDAAEEEWDAEFASCGEEALERLRANTDIDTVVTDMKMPGMNGGQLLAIISQKFPHVVRIVLSGEADKEAVFRAVNPMHQYLSKPCDANKLKETIKRATVLKKILNSQSLMQVIGSISALPSVPKIYKMVINELENEESSTAAIGEIIARDAAMTAKILQLANSAVFGLRSTVHTAAQAVTMLGVEAIKSLVLSFGIFREFENVSGFSIDSFMDHSLKVGGIARLIATSEALDKESINIAFTSGMLHDIGKLALLRADADAFQRCIQNALAKNLSSWEAEREIFGSDHAQVGAHMLFIWGLPQSIIEAVALHHNPDQSGEKVFSAITAVASANELCHKPDENADRKQRFEDYLSAIGCLERLGAWQELCDA